MSNFKSIGEYFSDNRVFVVPYYQRGYKWSLQTNTKRGDLHLSLLLSDLTSEFKKARVNGGISPYYEYYLQGITVKETDTEIELVDGQQRTTSLFILLSSLQQIGITKDAVQLKSKLLYKVRKAANKTLQQFINGKCAGDDSIQDVFALKKAWRLCQETVKKLDDPVLFGKFLLENIKVIYIKLDNLQDEARVFSMMNKAKAEMTQTDLVKSNLLREASRQMFGELHGQIQKDGLEWQINQLRGKLATEWDNWRKWWENKHHSDFGRMIALTFPVKDSDEPDMAAILKFYGSRRNEKITNTELFEFFKRQSVKHNINKIDAIEVFNELRLIQSVIQEWYNDTEISNYLGLFFKGSGLKEKNAALLILFNEYVASKRGFVSKIKRKYISQILGDDPADMFIDSLIDDDNAYYSKYTIVARQLLRMNVLMANKQKQRFDFKLYEENNFKNKEEIEDAQKRSLEHIKPQTYRNDKLSKAEKTRLTKLTNTIGNLVLVPKGLNSKLSNKKTEEKKRIIFEEMLKPDSRNFGLWLHTLSVFGSNAQWLSKEIKANETAFRNELTNFFTN
jgi:hypothetical protein